MQSAATSQPACSVCVRVLAPLAARYGPLMSSGDGSPAHTAAAD